MGGEDLYMKRRGESDGQSKHSRPRTQTTYNLYKTDPGRVRSFPRALNISKLFSHYCGLNYHCSKLATKNFNVTGTFRRCPN